METTRSPVSSTFEDSANMAMLARTSMQQCWMKVNQVQILKICFLSLEVQCPNRLSHIRSYSFQMKDHHEKLRYFCSIENITRDLASKERPAWPLTSYGPFDDITLVEGLDVSPEEMRLSAVAAWRKPEEYVRLTVFGLWFYDLLTLCGRFCMKRRNSPPPTKFITSVL